MSLDGYQTTFPWYIKSLYTFLHHTPIPTLITVFNLPSTKLQILQTLQNVLVMCIILILRRSTDTIHPSENFFNLYGPYRYVYHNDYHLLIIIIHQITSLYYSQAFRPINHIFIIDLAKFLLKIHHLHNTKSHCIRSYAPHLLNTLNHLHNMALI